MKLTWTLLIVTAVFESSGARHVISDYKRSMPDQEPSRNDVYYIDLTERQDITDNDVTDAVEQEDEESNSRRNPFNDFFPFVGNHVYDDTVNKYIVKKLFHRTVNELVPTNVYEYYKKIEQSGSTLYKVIAPFNEAVTEYSYKKLRAGVDWGLIGGYKYARSNVARLFS